MYINTINTPTSTDGYFAVANVSGKMTLRINHKTHDGHYEWMKNMSNQTLGVGVPIATYTIRKADGVIMRQGVIIKITYGATYADFEVDGNQINMGGMTQHDKHYITIGGIM